MRNANGWNWRRRPSFCRLAGVVVVSGFALGGCDTFFAKPEPEPLPAEVPEPKPDFFDANDGITTEEGKVTKRNDGDPANPALPESFRAQSIVSGELISLRSVTKTKLGDKNEFQETLSREDLMRLAGIRSPAPGQPGHQQTVAQMSRWLLGMNKDGTMQDLDVHQDARFPTDLAGRPVVEIQFKGREGKTKDQLLLLNRMLVRLGYAIVDVNAPTVIDVKPWLNDEQYARNHKLGLWGVGNGEILIKLGRRPPLAATRSGVAGKQKVTIRKTVTTRSIETRAEGRTPGGAPPVPGGRPAPGGPAGAPPPPAPAPGAPGPGGPGGSPMPAPRVP